MDVEDVRRRFLSSSPEATEALGECLGSLLVRGDVVALSGEMGSGKTCFVRGLARGMGVVDAVTSPTFTLMQEYEGRLKLYHFDAWMAGRESHFLEGGGAEYLGGEGVAVVEWAERVGAWIPRAHYAVTLEHVRPEERRLTLRWTGCGATVARGAASAPELAAHPLWALEARDPGLREETVIPGEPSSGGDVSADP